MATGLFFPVAFDKGAAKAVCVSCPVRQESLAYALGDPEVKGTWGGATERERTKMRGWR